MSSQPRNFLSAEQYLEIERAAERKSEYYHGEMFAMAGASEPHNLLVARLLFLIGQQIEERACTVYPSDMRVLVASAGMYTYADVTALCGEPRFTDDRRDTLINPGLIIEVLSPSTETYDRGRKAEHYRAMDSLIDYVLIASDGMHVELHARQPDGRWLRSRFSRPDDVIELRSIDCRLSLGGIYRKINLPPSQAPA